MIFVIVHSPIAQQFNYLYYCFEISSFFKLILDLNLIIFNLISTFI